MEEITKLEYILFAINTIPTFLLPLIYITFFKKEDLNSVKKLGILLSISIFLGTLIIGSSVWLNLINSKKASPPFLELLIVYLVYLIHKMFIIKKKEQNKPTD